MKNLFFGSSLLVGILLTGCGDTAKYSKLAEELNNSQTHNNKEIEAVGTIEVPTGLFAMEEGEKQKVLMSVSAGYEKIKNIELDYGKDKKNSMFVDIPKDQEEFEGKDFKLYDKNGKLIKRSNVRIKGTVKYGKDGDADEYVIQNVQIEQAE